MTYNAERAVREYLDRHLAENVTVRAIAEHAGLHPSYLNTCFKAQTGISIKHYIHRRKTDEAKRLLRETPCSISEISSTLGYFDQSHFTRTFRQMVGSTPKQYRLRYFSE